MAWVVTDPTQPRQSAMQRRAVRSTAEGRPAGPAPACWLGLSVVSCTLGVATKEVAVVTPVLVLLHDRAFISGTFRAAIHRRAAFYLGLFATWLPLAALVLGEFRRLSRDTNPGAPLSDREREVLQLVARGHKYKEISASLFIAEKTVENHVRNILGKLHLNRREELIRFAVEHGLD